MVFLDIFSKIFVECMDVCKKCRGQECSLCCSKILGCIRRQSVVAFLKVAGLSVENTETNFNMCICEACIRQVLKAVEKGEPYQLRDKGSLCCVPRSSVDIKAEKCEFTWEVICDTVGNADVESPVDISLCTQHFQQIYRMLNAKARAINLLRK